MGIVTNLKPVDTNAIVNNTFTKTRPTINSLFEKCFMCDKSFHINNMIKTDGGFYICNDCEEK